MTSDGERDYWETRLGEHFTLDGVGYLGLGKSFNAWMYRVRRVIVMRRLRSLLKELATRDVLDVGSGTGFYIDLWRRLGVRSVTGSDITEKAVEELSARYPSNRFMRLDIGAEENPLAEGGFDVATAFDVLFHIVDDEHYRRAFRNIAHALKPGGLLVFTDNFVHGLTASSSTQSSRTVSDIGSHADVGGLRGRREASVLRADEHPDRFAQQSAALLVAIAHTRGRGERRVRLDCGSCALSHRDRALLDPSRGPEHGDDGLPEGGVGD